MRRLLVFLLLGLAVGIGRPGASSAQGSEGFLAPGSAAPDIEFTGATRYGVLAERVRLSDYEGETVVLAFFFRARSGG